MTGGAGGQKDAGGAGEIGRRGRGVGRTKAARRRGAPAVCGRAFPGAERAGDLAAGRGQTGVAPSARPSWHNDRVAIIIPQFGRKNDFAPTNWPNPPKGGGKQRSRSILWGKTAPLLAVFSKGRDLPGKMEKLAI
ncbi:hypothetical protein HMPREF0262_00119 [Clostridium sp. ATCC 29733]|nr:hypothetical protein HMPREF0262_00119 [Clostridium sp. ATCC 29733]